MESPNEWWGPDLTPPRGPDQVDLAGALTRMFVSMGRAYGKGIRTVMLGLRPIISALDEAITSTHDTAGCFDLISPPADMNYQGRKRPRDPNCHKTYPTSTRQDHRPFIVKMNTHIPKSRRTRRR